MIANSSKMFHPGHWGDNYGFSGAQTERNIYPMSEPKRVSQKALTSNNPSYPNPFVVPRDGMATGYNQSQLFPTQRSMVRNQSTVTPLDGTVYSRANKKMTFFPTPMATEMGASYSSSRLPYIKPINTDAGRYTRVTDDSESSEEDNGRVMKLFEKQQNALNNIAHDLAWQSREKQNKEKKSLEDRLRKLEMETLMKEQERKMMKLLQMKEEQDKEARRLEQEKMKLERNRDKGGLSGFLEQFIQAKLMGGFVEQQPTVVAKPKPKKPEEDEESEEEERPVRSKKKKKTITRRRKDDSDEDSDTGKKPKKRDYAKELEEKRLAEQKAKEQKEQEEKDAREKELADQKAKRARARRNIKIVMWNYLYPTILFNDIKTQVFKNKAQVEAEVNNGLGNLVDSTTTMLQTTLGPALTEIYKDKNSYVFIPGIDKKSLDPKEIDKRTELMLQKAKKVLNLLINSVTSSNYQPHMLKLLATMSEERGVLPKTFMFDFEVKRLNFTYQATLKNINADKSKMIVGMMVFLRVFLHKLIFRPWDHDKTLNAKNTVLVLNLRILGSVMFHCMIEYYKSKLAVQPNNQAFLSPEIKIKSREPLKIADESKDEDQIILETKMKKDEKKDKKDEDSVLTGIFSREEMSGLYNDRKKIADEIKALIECWHTKIYDVIHAYYEKEMSRTAPQKK
jgi:hypothetical protein